VGASATGIADATAKQARIDLTRRLRTRRPEIERAVLTRVNAVSASDENLDSEYVEGLRDAISAAVAYGLDVIEFGEERAPSPPPVLIVQARLAARTGVSLDTVLRRYFAGHALVVDFLIEEAEPGGLLGDTALRGLLRAQSILFDRLLAVVSEEHTREVESRLATAEQRRLAQVERLLAGELVDTSGFPYDFGAHHLGLLADGPGALLAIRELARSLDRRLLTVCRGESEVWAWLGGRRELNLSKLGRCLATAWPARVSLAAGEPTAELEGWRLTHRQAKAAMPISKGSRGTVVHYADVALLAAIQRDDLLAASLREAYLVPLEAERDGGVVAKETLQAYFGADRNASSAAVALGVSRRTVENRLIAVERRLGRSLRTYATEMEMALRIPYPEAF
jgi:hypothetical protein